MFALVLISGIASIVLGCIGISDLVECARTAPNFAACKTRLLRGIAFVVVPAGIMLLSMWAICF